MKATTIRRLAKLEAQANARRRANCGYVAVQSVHDLTDEQLEAAARGDLTVFVGVSPDDWTEDHDETN